MVMVPSAGASIGRIDGLILGRSAGDTSAEVEDMLLRFLAVRPPRESAWRTGLMDVVVGEVRALVVGVGREVFWPERVAEPGVLRGPSLGVLRAEMRGVEQSSFMAVSMRPRTGREESAGSGRLSSSMSVPLGEASGWACAEGWESRVFSRVNGVAGTAFALRLELEFEQVWA